MAKLQTIGASEINAAIERLAAAISERHSRTPKLLLLGVADGGVELARRLAAEIVKRSPERLAQAGVLDISFHRDDIAEHPLPKESSPTNIPADVQDATVILVDDVISSGRTVKAALDELFDNGRPDKVELAVLIDRGGRKLPIAADYVGMTLAVGEREKIVLTLDRENPKRDSIRFDTIPFTALNDSV